MSSTRLAKFCLPFAARLYHLPCLESYGYPEGNFKPVSLWFYSTMLNQEYQIDFHTSMLIFLQLSLKEVKILVVNYIVLLLWF